MEANSKPVVIKTENLTKSYGYGRGIFDVNLEIRQGEAFGFIGTNGSGKTTTIRCLMGFLKPTSGISSVTGLNSWKQPHDIMGVVSYIPGEINFPPLKTGTVFLNTQAEYLKMKNPEYRDQLIKALQLDPEASLRHMSKGMKQKTAIVAALMAEKDILIMDEPTTGLDPLMRETFLDLMHQEKEKGRTIFMSTQSFSEAEDLCDRVALIKDGKILAVIDLYQLRHSPVRTYEITLSDKGSIKALLDFSKGKGWQAQEKDRFVQVILPTKEVNDLLEGVFSTSQQINDENS